jgi:hypothetical protein
MHDVRHTDGVVAVGANQKNNMKTKYHRDGSVTFWNIFTQTWQRRSASRISDEILSSLSSAERTRIARMAARC